MKSQSPALGASRLSARSRWIRQKKAATMDPRALNEIFMVTTDNK
ncbi:ZYBA0S07-02762g1_1 [Zygosaccharomyces bailii CLIB 213]|uniref:ZYBA0S07-02762g1_1 n=1 Tax=Zygosaccharomyces bailii (strain CLIB 213 / ATCC 58445 / CBS 680 / BCRC 21525 / NBRC 1098 / NCYC 1416 / NRRL Y-2227) TaxID=1333698 RepID=A0A8J2T928_ZYGB2|nr:ZYBA0S07-02762g1_1 [Zygosaccharomyces bailii CLIB 213]